MSALTRRGLPARASVVGPGRGFPQKYAVKMLGPNVTGSGTGSRSRAGQRRADLLAAIAQAPAGLGIKALAEATGIHENTVRFHLDRLLDEGLVERRAGTSTGPGRPPLTFVARQERPGRDNYELIAQVLSDSLNSSAPDPARAAREAGRQWGRSRIRDGERGRTPAGGVARGRGGDAVLERLTHLLREAGFAPELVSEDAGTTVRVHRCPFLSLSQDDQAVPCGVHLGLMEGALEAQGSTLQVTRLEPFVTPSLCVAHLEGATGG